MTYQRAQRRDFDIGQSVEWRDGGLADGGGWEIGCEGRCEDGSGCSGEDFDSGLKFGVLCRVYDEKRSVTGSRQPGWRSD